MRKKTNNSDNLKVNLKNYEMAFSHYKEQDQLRNTAFGFFTSLTIAVAGLIGIGKVDMINTIIFVVIFLVGIIISIVFCRYRTYGQFYSYTLSIYRKILTAGDNTVIDRKFIEENIKNKINSKPKKSGLSQYYSADFLLYLSLVIINCLNLFIAAYKITYSSFRAFDVYVEYYPFLFYGFLALLVILYVFISFKVYKKLVNYYVDNSLKNGNLEKLLFLDMYIEKNDNK